MASIVIGLSYDHAIDVWAVGCTLFELYTGRTLLQGRTNNEMLRLMMELKGKLPIRMLKKGSFVKDHFDDDGMFNSIEVSGDGKVRKGLCTLYDYLTRFVLGDLQEDQCFIQTYQ